MADRANRAARERQLGDLDDPPDAGLEEIEQRAQLFRLVERLPQDQRRVVGMRFADGKSIREIAKELGRTEGALKQLQFRALKNLRARMGDQNAWAQLE